MSMKISSKKIIISALSRIDDELYTRIAESGDAAGKEALDGISAQIRAATDPEAQEYLGEIAQDEVYYSAEVSSWSRVLATIALYHEIEKARARMLNVAVDGSQDYHRVTDFEAGLQAIGIQHQSVDSYADVDKLRRVVNNIKHSGLTVGEQLDGHYSFALGQEIKIDLADVSQYSTSARKYLKDLCDKLNRQIH